MNLFKKIMCVLAFANLSILADSFKEKAFEQELFAQFKIAIDIDQNWIDILNGNLAQFGYKNLLPYSDWNALFIAYPALQAQVPYISFGALPTPIEKLETLSNSYNAQIYIKQDSVSGGFDQNGAPLYGGNKVRKLEFLLAQAKALGATKVLTFGCVASNHAVATAVHASQLGMYPICMLKHQPPSHVVQHNLMMHLNYNTELHYSPNNDIRKLNAMTVWLDHYKKDGQVPYIIPTGGSNKYGTIGFVNAIFELVTQIEEGLMPRPTHIYVPCGSCATTAGILLGCKATGLDVQIVAVAVEPDEDPTFAQNIDTLFKETNQYLHSMDKSFPLCSYTEQDLRIDQNFTGPSYGVFTQEGVQAALELQNSDGIVLDGTYTAKAFACLLNDVTKQPGAVVLFWNTYSGLDFSKQLKSRDYTKLPTCLHDYFDENNIQPLDRN